MVSPAFCSVLVLTVWLSISAVQSKQCGYNGTGLEGAIRSPVEEGFYYRETYWCEWIITVPPVYRIALEVVKFSVYTISDGMCLSDFVHVESMTESGAWQLHDIPVCGVISSGTIIMSVENQLRIKHLYKPKSNANSYFTLKYKAVPLEPLEVAKYYIEKDLKNENLPKAVSSLFFLDETYFKKGNPKAENITNRFRLQIGKDLVRNSTRPMGAGDIALRVSGLLAVCINPRSFSGVDLVNHMRKLVDNVTGIPNPYIYLTLCNAGDEITDHDIKKLTAVAETQKHEMYWLDYQATAVLALVCIRNRDLGYDVKEILKTAVDELKSHQFADGGFGSVQTTSLVIQALTAAETKVNQWNRTSAINFINNAKQWNDSFDNVQDLYAVVPVISGKTLLNLNASRCDFSKDDVGEIRSNHSKPIQLVYSLWIGDHIDVSSTVTLKAPKGTNFFDFMRLAADQEEKFKFKWINTTNAAYVFEIGGLMNDPSSGRYWTLHTGTHVKNIKPYGKGLERYIPEDGEMAVMWYKVLTIGY